MAPHRIAVGELASHTHAQYVTANPGTGNYNTRIDYKEDALNVDTYYQVETGATGGNNYHNNISPCVAAYLWKRTA